MRLKSGFMLREIAGQWVVVPLGERVVEFNGIMTLSESGSLIWKLMEKGVLTEDIVAALLAEYDVEESQVRIDVEDFLDSLKANDLIEE